jgi:hypothetical protein
MTFAVDVPHILLKQAFGLLCRRLK